MKAQVQLVKYFFSFLDASSHLFEALSVRWSVRPLVGPSNSIKIGLLRIQNDLDSSGRGRKIDEEDGGTKKEGRGDRR